ncbi:MAG: hypothetical protein P8J37_04100 [Fuerstiella sp.]|nr:hypothetical protein [Fuerstiella sp.]
MSEDSAEFSADGAPSGNGRLTGILFNDYQLGRPFDLGIDGTFTAPDNGRLLLRCRDEWNQLGDNKGTIAVELMSSENR